MAADASPAAASRGESGVFGWPFWCAYVANASLVAANSLLFRYVEFVRLYEPNQPRLWLGWIVGVGMLGSLLMRLVQGPALDRYGARRIWVTSAVVFTLTCLAHVFITHINGPDVFLLRIIFSSSLAGAFGSSMVYVSRRATPERMAEMIGTLGTSGFVGMIFGPILGDLLFRVPAIERWHIDRMFLVATLLGLITLVFASLATRGQLPPVARRKQPPVLWLLRRYYPGPVVMVGIAMGIGIGVSTNFLADFAGGLGIQGIWLYFNSFAVTAFITRLSIRQFPQKYGIRSMLLVGISAQVLCFLLYLPITQQWHFIFAAMAAGFAHAFLFPAVVAGGGTAFPERYRGIGTTLMLGTLDFGILIGAPLAGVILDNSRKYGLPPYPTTFISVAVLLLGVGWYYVVSRPSPATRYRASHERTVVRDRAP